MTAPVSTEALGGIGIVSAATLALFGVPLQPIIWAFIGGFLGSGFAKPAGWLVTVGSYLSASLLSALCGHSLAAYWFNASPTIGNGLAALTAVFFHPLLTGISARLPALLDIAQAIFSRKGQP